MLVNNKDGNSRTKNSVRNIVFSLLAYGVQIVLAFIVRRYFIYYFNEEYLGLNSLFSNILSLLSLAELGFGSAIVFSMYKPMAEGDDEKVRELLHLYKKYYSIIAIVVTCLGLLVLPFMGYFADKAPNVMVNLYAVYLIFLFNSVISYFCAYRRALFFTSQRNDIESKINIITNLFLNVAQLLVIIFVRNYYCYLALSTVSTLLNSIFVFVFTNKHYSSYIKRPAKPLDKETRKTISKNVYSLIFHKIGSAVVYSTDSLIIYLVLNAVTLGLYSNYLLIISAVTTLISLIANAIKGSIGNSIATRSPEENFKLCKKINFIYMWIVSFCAICIFALANPFIDTILTKSDDANLTLNFVILILISYNFYFLQAKGMVGMFKECVGLFYQDRFKPLAEAMVNLIVSLILAYFIGLPGVIIGTIVSSVSTCIWVEPYVLNKYYFKKSTARYLFELAFRTFVTTVIGALTYFVCGLIPSGGIGWLLVKFVVCAIVPNLLLLLCYFWTPEFKQCVAWGKELISSFKNRKHKVAMSGNIEQAVDNAIIEAEVLAGESTEIVGEELQNEVVVGEIDSLGEEVDGNNSTDNLQNEGVVSENKDIKIASDDATTGDKDN